MVVDQGKTADFFAAVAGRLRDLRAKLGTRAVPLRERPVDVLRRMAEDLDDEVERRHEAHHADSRVECPGFLLLIDELEAK